MPATSPPESVERLTYSMAESAELLGVTRQHLHSLIRTGVIPSLKLGRRRLIRRDALNAVLADLETGGGDDAA